MILMTLLKSNAYKIHCIVLWVKYWYRITKHLYKKFNNIAPMTYFVAFINQVTNDVCLGSVLPLPDLSTCFHSTPSKSV